MRVLDFSATARTVHLERPNPAGNDPDVLRIVFDKGAINELTISVFQPEGPTGITAMCPRVVIDPALTQKEEGR